MTAIGVIGPGAAAEADGAAVDLSLDEAAAELRLLELRHRIKNILAIVQSLVNQTLRDGVAVKDARELLGSRLVAIGHAVDLLLSSSWRSAPLGNLIRSAMTSGGEHVLAEGPDVQVGPSAAMMLSILFHELECNAIKYGALSAASGSVRVAWEVQGDWLHLDWEERDGPEINVPVSEGFGSKLVGRIATRFGGRSEANFDRNGLRWRFAAPVAALQA